MDFTVLCPYRELIHVYGDLLEYCCVGINIFDPHTVFYSYIVRELGIPVFLKAAIRRRET